MHSASTGKRPVRAPRRSYGATASRSVLRETGIRVLGDMPWGSHSCIFYESKEDLIETAVEYFRAGMASNEFCMWAVSEPITVQEAEHAMRRRIPNFAAHLAARRVEILRSRDWYFEGGVCDPKRLMEGWQEKLISALARGFEGLRASGNALWIDAARWAQFSAYEREINRSVQDRKMIMLCTYALGAIRAADVLDVTHAHRCSATRRNGEWEILEAWDLRQAKDEIKRLSGALEVLSKPFPRHKLLTPRERVVLAQIVRGASNKEAGRALDIGPRTIEFHRANVMRKLGAKNTADLVRKVVSGG